MKTFGNWPIRYKLIVPLLLVVVLGGGAIVSAFVKLSDTITLEALPEERALDGIRSASLELLSEYREFMVMPNDSTLQEIHDLKMTIARYKATFDEIAAPEVAEFGAAIRSAVQSLKRQGDRAIDLRRQLLDTVAKLEPYESFARNLPARDLVGIDASSSGDASEEERRARFSEAHDLRDVVHDYLSEIREFGLLAHDSTLQEIAEIERILVQSIEASNSSRASIGTERSLNALELAQLRELIEIGRTSAALTADFLVEAEILEETEDELLAVLLEASIDVGRDTDAAFETGSTLR